MKKVESSLSSGLRWKQGECHIHGPYRAATYRPDQLVECPHCAGERDQERLLEEIRESQKALTAKKFASAGIPPIFSEATLAGYVLTSRDSNQKRALDACVSYCADFENVIKSGRCMIFLGNVGTGKTHLAVAIMREVIAQGWEAKMATIADYFRDCKKAWTKKAEVSEIEVLESYFKPDLLVIDEVGVQFGSKTELDLTFNLINKRYNYAKPNIVIANLEKEQLQEYLGEATYDRLKGGVIVNFTWNSARGLDVSGLANNNKQAGQHCSA